MTTVVRLHRRVMARLREPGYWADAAGWFTAAALVQALMGVDVAGLALTTWLVAGVVALWGWLADRRRRERGSRKEPPAAPAVLACWGDARHPGDCVRCHHALASHRFNDLVGWLCHAPACLCTLVAAPPKPEGPPTVRFRRTAPPAWPAWAPPPAEPTCRVCGHLAAFHAGPHLVCTAPNCGCSRLCGGRWPTPPTADQHYLAGRLREPSRVTP